LQIDAKKELHLIKLKKEFIMKKNVGTIDKLVRVVISGTISTLFILEVISGTLGIVLMIFAITFLLTGFFSFCPLYTLFGINTCKLDKK
jgi:hypothetical protein